MLDDGRANDKGVVDSLQDQGFAHIIQSSPLIVLRSIQGGKVTISCEYTGKYVHIEFSKGGRAKATTLFTRIGEVKTPFPIDGKSRNWYFNRAESNYDSGTNGGNKITIQMDQIGYEDEGFYKCKDGWKNVTEQYQLQGYGFPE